MYLNGFNKLSKSQPNLNIHTHTNTLAQMHTNEPLDTHRFSPYFLSAWKFGKTNFSMPRFSYFFVALLFSYNEDNYIHSKYTVPIIENWFLKCKYNPKYKYCRNFIKKGYDECYNGV